MDIRLPARDSVILASMVLVGIASPASAQVLAGPTDPPGSHGLSIGAPARVQLHGSKTEWLIGQVGETTEGCYIILFFPTQPGDLPWATHVAPLHALEVAVDSTAAGYTWQPMSIEAVGRSEPAACRPQPHLISRRAAVG